MGTAALVLGIISLALSLGVGAAGMGWIGSICGVVGIVLGAIAVKKGGADKGRGQVGLILCIIALALGIIVTVICVACMGAAMRAGADFLNSIAQ